MKEIEIDLNNDGENEAELTLHWRAILKAIFDFIICC